MLTRVLSGVVLIAAVLGIVWLLPPMATGALIVVVLMIARNEFARLTARSLAGLAPVLRYILLGAAFLAYVMIPLVFVYNIRTVHGPGVVMILFGLIVVSDSAQYFVGRAFGRHKLAPVISPKKTIEGAVGGAVFGAIAGVALSQIWLPAVSPVAAALVSLLMAIAGMAGDLFESALKRRAGLKDSGNLIPGHGGILDRIDSWLFAAPVFWVFLRVWA